MTILMVLDHEFPPDIRVENEMEALIAAGHELHLACYTRKKRVTEEIWNGVYIHRKIISKFIYKSSVGALKFPFYFNFWLKFLKQLWKQHDFDAIHIHDLPLAQVGYELAYKNKIPFTLDLHENWPALLRIATHTQSLLGRLLSSNKQWTSYENSYCQKADNIITVVHEAKERLLNLGIPSDKIHVVSNTLNLDHFELPTGSPDEKYTTLLYAGGINRHRGLQYVIEGLQFLKNQKKPVRLWILGTGSYLNELKNLAKALHVEEQVIFMGWKNYTEMQKYFAQSDICLIPHLKTEHTDSTIPHKLFQYMYAGKPVVASNCEPIQRILEETKGGLVYTYNDPKAFAEKIKALSDNSKLYNRLVINGRKAVAEKYNWKNDSDILCQIYL